MSPANLSLRHLKKTNSLPQKSRLIHTGLQPGARVDGEIENRFNGFSCGSACNSLCSIASALINESNS
jgi:hypothetical protein